MHFGVEDFDGLNPLVIRQWIDLGQGRREVPVLHPRDAHPHRKLEQAATVRVGQHGLAGLRDLDDRHHLLVLVGHVEQLLPLADAGALAQRLGLVAEATRGRRRIDHLPGDGGADRAFRNLRRVLLLEGHLLIVLRLDGGKRGLGHLDFGGLEDLERLEPPPVLGQAVPQLGHLAGVGILLEQRELALPAGEVELGLHGDEDVGLELRAGQVAVLLELAGPRNAVLGALELLLGDGDGALSLLEELRVIALVVRLGVGLRVVLQFAAQVLPEVQLGQLDCELRLVHARPGLVLDHRELLPGSDEIGLGPNHLDVLPFLLLHEGGRIELEQHLAGLDVGTLVDEPDHRRVALELALDDHLVAVVDRARASEADRQWPAPHLVPFAGIELRFLPPEAPGPAASVLGRQHAPCAHPDHQQAERGDHQASSRPAPAAAGG